MTEEVTDQVFRDVGRILRTKAGLLRQLEQLKRSAKLDQADLEERIARLDEAGAELLQRHGPIRTPSGELKWGSSTSTTSADNLLSWCIDNAPDAVSASASAASLERSGFEWSDDGTLVRKVADPETGELTLLVAPVTRQKRNVPKLTPAKAKLIEPIEESEEA